MCIKMINNRLKIPMRNNKRSLNISSSVAIVLAELLKTKWINLNGSRNKTKTSTAYCQPIDEIEPDVQNEASLEVPLKGKYSLKDSEYEYIKTVVSFTSYFLVNGVWIFRGSFIV